MSNSIKNLAFIPARGGSKGLPGKNTMLFNGKPLIAWTIEHALKSRYFDRVIVSTDCPVIAEVSKCYGAEVPFMRPAQLSSDCASTEDALLHCCDYLKNNGCLPINIALLQCTSPIRFDGTLDRAYCYFKDENYDSILSVTKNHRFFWKGGENLIANYDFTQRPRRQDICGFDQDYMETGSFYFTTVECLIESQNRLSGSIGLFETDYMESFEIDTLIDFKLCEFLMSQVATNED